VLESPVLPARNLQLNESRAWISLVHDPTRSEHEEYITAGQS